MFLFKARSVEARNNKQTVFLNDTFTAWQNNFSVGVIFDATLYTNVHTKQDNKLSN